MRVRGKTCKDPTVTCRENYVRQHLGKGWLAVRCYWDLSEFWHRDSF